MNTYQHEFAIAQVSKPAVSPVSKSAACAVVCLALILASVVSGRAITLPFEGQYVEPFYTPKAEVVWAATNSLRLTVRVFKVAAANYSATAISNLTQLGGKADAKRGWMSFYQAMDEPRKLEGVPDKARAFELGTNLLARLEIPLTELETDGQSLKAGFRPGWRGRFDKATRQHVTEPCVMGVEFRRVLDGVLCYGQYVDMQFSSLETLTHLEVKWHGLSPVGSYDVASPEQIIAWIKEGRARAHPIETTGSRWIKTADINRVVIRNIQIVYDAGPNLGLSDSPPKYLYPCAGLLAEIEFSPGDVETLGLSCPITKAARCGLSRKTAEFNILPRDFNGSTRAPEGGE
jgi:hypothetical protein